MSTKSGLAHSDRVYAYRDLMDGDDRIHLRVHDLLAISIDTEWRNTAILSMTTEQMRELRRVLNEAHLGEGVEGE